MDRTDWLSVAAVSLAAMCVVTFDHEALGHGGACLLLHGRILLLTSSVFHCDAKSDWIDAAGPFSNLVMGALAFAGARLAPRRWTAARLFLILAAAFSWFWEWGYLARAMLKRDGDLYFFARAALGEPALWLRLGTAAAALVMYWLTARAIAAELAGVWPDRRTARGVARTAWACASAGAAIAALANTAHDWADVSDAVLEIGVASLPLLVIPLAEGPDVEAGAGGSLARRPALIGLGAAVYLLFVATLGRGVRV